MKRCMNRRQLQSVNKLSLNDDNKTDVEIKKKLAERKKLIETVDLQCENEENEGSEEDEENVEEEEDN